MTDLEHDDILRLLSVPADRQPGGVSRRRFLQGALAAGTIASLPSVFDPLAAAATPIGPHDGILVVIQLGGGNDGSNTVVPLTEGAYRSLRGDLAITDALPISSTFGLHPSLPNLAKRHADGKVAVVHGVGQATTTDLSHFSSTASWMAGSTAPTRTSGWLGRWLDGVPEAADGLRAVAVGSSIPLHLVGNVAQATAMQVDGDLFGSDRSETWEAALYDAVAACGAASTGRGAWADRIGATGARAMDLATEIHPVLTPELPDDSIRSQLTLVARLIAADLGIRVFTLSCGSFDTHEGQAWQHAALLSDLDAAIDAFYQALPTAFSSRVALMTFSEFGRRPEANGSAGTDHGTSSVLFVIGDQVKGGAYGEHPKLDRLDDRGDPLVTVDHRSVYASLLGPWLGGDAAGVLGGTYEDLKLFRAGPGQPFVPPVTSGPWRPFATASDLVRQQYLDFQGRAGDAGGVRYWTGQLTSGKRTIPAVIEAFLDSPEFGRVVAPVARLALVGLGGRPSYADLSTWAAQRRSGADLATVAAAVAERPAFVARFGSLSPADAVALAYRSAIGRGPSAAESAAAVARLGSKAVTRAGLVAELVVLPAAEARWRPEVEVLMTYAGLLRRGPDASGWTYWVGKVRSGTGIQRLIAQFFSSPEYRRRFAA